MKTPQQSPRETNDACVQQKRWVRPHLVLSVTRDLHAAHGVHELEVGHELLAVRRGLRGHGHRY